MHKYYGLASTLGHSMSTTSIRDVKPKGQDMLVLLLSHERYRNRIQSQSHLEFISSGNSS